MDGRGLAIALVVGLLLGGAVTYVLAGASLGRVTTSTVPKTVTSTATSTTSTTITAAASSIGVSGGPSLYVSGVSPTGIELEMALNTSSIQSHGALIAEIEVVNTLDRNVSLSMPPWSANQTIYVWSGYDQICNENPSDFVASFEVLQGHFTAANISAAGTPLREAAPFYPPCPGGAWPGGVTLLPNSDLTNYTDINYSVGPPRPSYTVKAEVNATSYYCSGSGVSGNGGEVDCGNTPGLVGYWNTSISVNGDLNFTSPAFTYFPPGEYTIVAADQWNQYVYATFQVRPLG